MTDDELKLIDPKFLEAFYAVPSESDQQRAEILQRAVCSLSLTIGSSSYITDIKSICFAISSLILNCVPDNIHAEFIVSQIPLIIRGFINNIVEVEKAQVREQEQEQASSISAHATMH